MDAIVEEVLAVLKKGGTLLYPTDTIWGIGCDATNEAAVNAIYRIKKRTGTKSMLVLVDHIAMIRSYVQEIPSMALELLKVSDTPLTIIYPNAKNLASKLIAGDGSVGIRICKTEFCQNLIGKFQKPIVSTSANLSGDPSPATLTDIDPYIKEKVDYFVEISEKESFLCKKPSPIIKLGIDNTIRIIRP